MRAFVEHGRAAARTRRFWLAGCVLAVVAGAATVDAVAAERCYQDRDGRIVNRRRPGYVEVPCPGSESAQPAESEPETTEQGRMRRRGIAERPRPEAERRQNPVSPIPIPRVEDYVAAVPVPDRWRIVDTLAGYKHSLWDPYDRNVLKGDKPLSAGGNHFFVFTGIADTVLERREVPTPVGLSTTEHAGSIDVFGGSDQLAAVGTILAEFAYIEGDTVFQPPDQEFRLTLAGQYNYVRLDEVLGVDVDPVRRPHPHRPARRGAGRVLRQASAQRLRSLRLRQPAHRYTAVLLGFPRLSVSGQPTRRAPVRHPGQQHLPVQRRLVPPSGEGHQQRPERPLEVAAQGRRLHRQPVLAGHAEPGLHLAVDPGLQPQSRERQAPVRYQRLHRPAVVTRRRAAAQVRHRLSGIQRRRPFRPVESHHLAVLRVRPDGSGRLRQQEGGRVGVLRCRRVVHGLRLDPSAPVTALRQRRRRPLRQQGARLRRHRGKSSVCRRRHQLLDTSGGAFDRRR